MQISVGKGEREAERTRSRVPTRGREKKSMKIVNTGSEEMNGKGEKEGREFRKKHGSGIRPEESRGRMS